MKNLIAILGMILFGNIIVSSTSKIKVEQKIEEDASINADYILRSNEHKRIFGDTLEIKKQ